MAAPGPRSASEAGIKKTQQKIARKERKESVGYRDRGELLMAGQRVIVKRCVEGEWVCGARSERYVRRSFSIRRPFWITCSFLSQRPGYSH